MDRQKIVGWIMVVWSVGYIVYMLKARLLIEGPGWRVTRADEFSGEVGEITFSAGSRTAEIRWLPARERASALTGSEGSSDLVSTASVSGVSARVFRYEGIDGFTALWVSGAHAIELEGNAANLRAFKALLGSVRAVDVNAWLSAMPDSVVRPGSRESVVSGMLAGIPLPKGFERAQLDDGSTVRDPYQLGARVVAAVSCGWIEQWIAAKRAGDAGAVAEAVNAMGTSRNWRVLRQMESEGAYPAVVREYADAVARNGNVVGRYSAGDLTVEESYRSTLGCPQP